MPETPEKEAETEEKAPKKGKKDKELEKKKKEAMEKMVGNVKEFAGRVRDKFGKYVKSVIMFGSMQRKDFTAGSDVDILVIIDDTAIGQAITPDFRDTLYRQLCDIAADVDKKLHVQMNLLTEFWDFIRQGDPLFFNYIRNGTPILDLGFFEPLKRLLYMGAISPTKEAIVRSIEASKEYLRKIRTYWEWSVERMFRAVTWSCNSFLMASGMPPADPKEMAAVLQHYFVEQGKLEEDYPKILAEVTKWHKDIEHGVAGELKPELIMDLESKTKKFVERMDRGVKDYMGGLQRAEVLKDKIKSTPKVFWVYKDNSRGYAWLFEDSIIVAIYKEKEGAPPELAAVMEAKVTKKELTPFKPIEHQDLFKKLEGSGFKPIITPSLIAIILDHLPEETRGRIVQMGVEYPGRALLDLTQIMIKKKSD